MAQNFDNGNDMEGDDREKSEQQQQPLIKDTITVTVLSSMSGSPSFDVTIQPNATIADLKYKCISINTKLSNHIFVYDGKELKNDDASISEYGIIDNCTIRVVAQMKAGRRTTVSPTLNMARIIFFPPFALPEPSTSMENLRKAIRGMHCHRRISEQRAMPNKETEHAQIRKRIREIIEKKRQRSALYSNQGIKTNTSLESYNKTVKASNTEVPSINSLTQSEYNSAIPTTSISQDTGSIAGSVDHLFTRNDLSDPNLQNSETSTEETEEIEEVKTFITRKELLSYYEVPESKQELEIIHHNFYDPPQNHEELAKVKTEISTLCGTCRRRLPFVLQSIVCVCGVSFCNEHREKHNCNIDYKHTERAQLWQQNPKVSDTGARKGQTNDDK